MPSIFKATSFCAGSVGAFIFVAGGEPFGPLPQHQLDQMLLVGSRSRHCAHPGSVFQDGDAIADGKHIFQKVRNEDDAFSLRLLRQDLILQSRAGQGHFHAQPVPAPIERRSSEAVTPVLHILLEMVPASSSSQHFTFRRI
jgi:hypothetical protein